MLQPHARRRVLRVADLVAAVFLFFVLDGFEFGNSDDFSMLPWVYKWEDAGLYLNDLKFAAWPSPYYLFHVGYMVLLSAVMPIEWGLIATSMLVRLLLLVAMRRLAEQITGRSVPALLLAVLMSGHLNGHLVGGYFLLSPGFSTHYPAIALVLLSLSWFIDRRHMLAWLILPVAAVINPRLGLVGVAVLGMAWFWRQTPALRWRLAKGALAAGAVALAAFVAWNSLRSATGSDELVRVWMFVRAPWHYVPAYWSGFVFVNLALVAAGLGAIWRLRTEPRSRELLFVALVGVMLIAGGLANNQLLLSLPLVLANTFQFGPIVLALCYVFIAAVVVSRLHAGRYLSTLPVLVAPDLQTRLLVLLVAIVADLSRPPRPSGDVPGWRPDARELATVVVQVLAFLLAPILLPDSWRQPLDGRSGDWTIYVAGATVAGLLALSASRLLTPGRLVGAAALAYLATITGLGPVHGIDNRSSADPDAVALCQYVRGNTPVGAVFIIPPDMHDFQARCRRSAFFGFVHLPLRLELHPEWAVRLKLLRLIPPETDLARLSAPLNVDYQAYTRLSKTEFLEIKHRYDAVDYVLVREGADLDLPLAFHVGRYRLYHLTR